MDCFYTEFGIYGQPRWFNNYHSQNMQNKFLDLTGSVVDLVKKSSNYQFDFNVFRFCLFYYNINLNFEIYF